MNTQNTNFQLNVGFIVQQSIGFSRTFDFSIPKLDLEPDWPAFDLIGAVRFTRNSEGLLAQGEFQANVHTTCGRCLESATSHLQAEFTELWLFPSHATAAPDEPELILPDDGQIDLGPIVCEYLALEIPITPVCKPDCKGLCNICGNNLNLVSCDHGLDDVDPRLAVLKKLLDADDAT